MAALNVRALLIVILIRKGYKKKISNKIQEEEQNKKKVFAYVEYSKKKKETGEGRIPQFAGARQETV